MVSALSFRVIRLGAVLLLGAGLAACATTTPTLATAPVPTTPTGPVRTLKVGKPYQVRGVWYTPREQPGYDQVGVASWYGAAHQSKPTASGEPFDKERVSAAHTTLPLQSLVEVTNLSNGKTLQVRINDRGPFAQKRIIDLSQAAARRLGFERDGLAQVRVRYLGAAPVDAMRAAIAPPEMLAVVRPAAKAEGPLIFGATSELAGGYGPDDAASLLGR
jgi:rare lipoprotein A